MPEEPLFSAELNLPTDSRRRTTRTAVSMDIDIEGATFSRGVCRVLDISLHGLRMQTYLPVKKGSTVWMSLPGLARRKARVIWERELEAGCEFAEALSEDDVATIVSRTRATRPGAVQRPAA